MYIYTYKSITAKWWDNPRLAKQAVAKNRVIAVINISGNPSLLVKLRKNINKPRLAEATLFLFDEFCNRSVIIAEQTLC